jgi:DNA-directed RNA polymerase subunit K/omega
MPKKTRSKVISGGSVSTTTKVVKSSSKPKKGKKKKASSPTDGTPARESKIVSDEQPADEFDFEPEVKSRRGTPYMSQDEYAALITARSLQLLNPRYPPRVDPALFQYDSILIATEEVKLQMVPFIVRRLFPDGTTEDWKLGEMVLPHI